MSQEDMDVDYAWITLEPYICEPARFRWNSDIGPCLKEFWDKLALRLWPSAEMGDAADWDYQRSGAPEPSEAHAGLVLPLSIDELTPYTSTSPHSAPPPLFEKTFIESLTTTPASTTQDETLVNICIPQTSSHASEVILSAETSQHTWSISLLESGKAEGTVESELPPSVLNPNIVGASGPSPSSIPPVSNINPFPIPSVQCFPCVTYHYQPAQVSEVVELPIRPEEGVAGPYEPQSTIDEVQPSASSASAEYDGRDKMDYDTDAFSAVTDQVLQNAHGTTSARFSPLSSHRGALPPNIAGYHGLDAAGVAMKDLVSTTPASHSDQQASVPILPSDISAHPQVNSSLYPHVNDFEDYETVTGPSPPYGSSSVFGTEKLGFDEDSGNNDGGLSLEDVYTILEEAQLKHGTDASLSGHVDWRWEALSNQNGSASYAGSGGHNSGEGIPSGVTATPTYEEIQKAIDDLLSEVETQLEKPQGSSNIYVPTAEKGPRDESGAAIPEECPGQVQPWSYRERELQGHVQLNPSIMTHSTPPRSGSQENTKNQLTENQNSSCTPHLSPDTKANLAPEPTANRFCQQSNPPVPRKARTTPREAQLASWESGRSSAPLNQGAITDANGTTRRFIMGRRR